MPNLTYECDCKRSYQLFKYSTDAPERILCLCGGLATLVSAESTSVKDSVNPTAKASK